MTRNKEKAEKKTSSDKKMFSKWEAARRHRFNFCLEKLRLSIPDCDKKTKAEIIQGAIDYIQKCKAYKESVLEGNEFSELKEEIKKLKRQVLDLKHMNALLVKLVQETGFKIESRNEGREILCTIPGTCVQNNCTNGIVKKLSTGQHGQVVIEDNFQIPADDLIDNISGDENIESNPVSSQNSDSSLADSNSRVPRAGSSLESEFGNEKNVLSQNPSVSVAETSGRASTVFCGKESSSSILHSVTKSSIILSNDIKSSETSSSVEKRELRSLKKQASTGALFNPVTVESSIKSTSSVISSNGQESDSISVPLLNCEGKPLTIISENCEHKQVRVLPEARAVLSQNCGDDQEASAIPLSCVNEEMSILPQNCDTVIDSVTNGTSSESILVEDVTKAGMVTVSIIEKKSEREETGGGNSSVKSSQSTRSRKLESEITGKTADATEEIVFSSSDTCLVMQDMQRVAIHPEVQSQPASSGHVMPVQTSPFCNNNPQQRVSVQVDGGGGSAGGGDGDKESPKGQKVVVLQCNNPTTGTIQLVPPIIDNSQLTYVTPSLSSVPIMSTGVPPPILHGGRIVRMMNTCPVLLLPSNPIIPVPQPTRLKPIAPKPCSCKTSAISQSKDMVTDGSCSSAATDIKGLASPAKKDSKNQNRAKRSMNLDICDKPAKCSKNEFETDVHAISKLAPAMQSLQSLDPTPKPVHLSQVDMSNAQSPDLQEISTSTLTGLVHSAGIMDCVEDPLGNIMDIRVDMPCVIPETIRENGIEASNPADDRLVEMLRSIDESDPRTCDFSPPSSPITSPITSTEQLIKPVSKSESHIHGHIENTVESKVDRESQGIQTETSEKNNSAVEIPASVPPLPPLNETQTMSLAKTSSQGQSESTLNSSSYSITALCLSSKPQENVDLPLRSISTHSTPTSSNIYIPHLTDNISEISASVVTSTVMSNSHARVSTPLVLPNSMYPSASTPLPSRENLPKAASAPTVCPLSLQSTAPLPPPCIFLRPPILPVTSHSLPLRPLPPLPIPHLPPLTTEHHTSTHLPSPSLSMVDPSFSSCNSSTSLSATNSASVVSTLSTDAHISSAITLPNLFTTVPSASLASSYPMANPSPVFSFSLTTPSTSCTSLSSATGHSSNLVSSVTSGLESLSSSSETSMLTSGSIFSASFLHPSSSIPAMVNSHLAIPQNTMGNPQGILSGSSTIGNSVPVFPIPSVVTSCPAVDSKSSSSHGQASNESGLRSSHITSLHTVKDQKFRSESTNLHAIENKLFSVVNTSVQTSVPNTTVSIATTSNLVLPMSLERMTTEKEERNSANKVSGDSESASNSLSKVSSEKTLDKLSASVQSVTKEKQLEVMSNTDSSTPGSMSTVADLLQDKSVFESKVKPASVGPALDIGCHVSKINKQHSVLLGTSTSPSEAEVNYKCLKQMPVPGIVNAQVSTVDKLLPEKMSGLNNESESFSLHKVHDSLSAMTKTYVSEDKSLSAMTKACVPENKASHQQNDNSSLSLCGSLNDAAITSKSLINIPAEKMASSSLSSAAWNEPPTKQVVAHQQKKSDSPKEEDTLFYTSLKKVSQNAQVNQVGQEKTDVNKEASVVSTKVPKPSHIPSEHNSYSQRDTASESTKTQVDISRENISNEDSVNGTQQSDKYDKQNKLQSPLHSSDISPQTRPISKVQDSSPSSDTPALHMQPAIASNESLASLHLTRHQVSVGKKDQSVSVLDSTVTNTPRKTDQIVTSPRPECDKLGIQLQQVSHTKTHSTLQHTQQQHPHQQTQQHHHQHQQPKDNGGLQRSPAAVQTVSSQAHSQPSHQQPIAKYQSNQKHGQQHQPSSNSQQQQQQQQQHQLPTHHRTQQHTTTSLNQSHINQNALQKHQQSQTQQLNQQQQQQQQRQQQQQNPIVQQQVAGHTVPPHNNNNIITGTIIGEVGEVLTDKRTSGQLPGAVMQAPHQPGMVTMPYHPPMVSAPSYMQPPTYDYNAYCRKAPHSPRAEGRHQCYGYVKQHQYQHGDLLPPDPTMMADPRLPHNPPMPMPGPFIETADEPTPMRPEPSSEHVRYFSVSHLVSHSNESRKGSVSGQQKDTSTAQTEDKSKDSPRSKSGSRKSESKSRGTGSTKNSSQGDSHSRRRSPARGSQQGNAGTGPPTMWGNKSSPVHKQAHNYSTEALLSTQNYGRTAHRPPANNNYPIMSPNQMYQSNYSPQQMKNFVPNSSFGYSSHDRNGQGGCNPDYNFQLHTQASGSLAYGGNMAYMPTGYPYQNLPPSSSSMLSGDIMAPPHPAGPYPRFHEFPADQSNFPPNPTFPLPLDPQDVCSGGGLMGAASGSMSVRAPHSDMQLVPTSSGSSSVPYSRSNSNRNSGNIGITTSVASSINSGNHGIGSSSSSSGVSSKRPRYGETNMVSGGMGGSANLLEGGALAHISLHSFTPPCDDPTLVHSNLFPGTAPRHQSNFLLGPDTLMPINAAQYPGSSSGTGASGTGQLGTGSVAPPSGSRAGSSVVLPPGAPPGHVPFSPLRVMDRQQVNMAPPTAPHLSSSLSNFNLTSIIPDIDGKAGENHGGMGSSRGGGIGNNEVLGPTIGGQARLPPMPSSLLPPSEHLKGLPAADANRLPPPVLNNSMNNIFTHPPHHHHQVGLGLNSSLSLPPTSFSGINFPAPDH